MAWPQKGTRKLVIDGVPYLWHYSGRCPLCSEAVFTVGQSQQAYVLYIDPLPHDFEITPKSIAMAVKWAISQGWSSADGPTCAMALDTQTQNFIWLPDDSRHLSGVRG